MTAAWSPDDWLALEQRVTRRTRGKSDVDARQEVCRGARAVLRAFSSSFFLVTRFLPVEKRRRVDMIYAAVRYPDEVVDTFVLPNEAKIELLNAWEGRYEEALDLHSVRGGLDAGVPWILTGFADVVRECAIPPEYYRSFLQAMRVDAAPRAFRTFEDLIENYVYGSAIVVGYFLAHVYGAAEGFKTDDTYKCAADLGIALQLTNFARDVAEDRGRGRSYLPVDVVEARGRSGAIAFLATEAERRYERAVRRLDTFAADTRPAIRACIDVYRGLNRRILQARYRGEARHSVPMAEKFGALPASKYWRVPLAYLGGL
jgi:phytoene synthase